MWHNPCEQLPTAKVRKQKLKAKSPDKYKVFDTGMELEQVEINSPTFLEEIVVRQHIFHFIAKAWWTVA